jgi:hypothetical protein
MKKNIENLPFATEDECKAHREMLISAGIITPGNPTVRKFSETFKPAPKRKHVVSEGSVPEEGLYKRHAVSNQREYKARLANYFHVLQSVLRDRKRLNIKFEKRQ